MNEPEKISKVRLSEYDLVEIIKRRGAEQKKQVDGPYLHYAHAQARLLLAAEDVFDMLSRVVRETKRLKQRTPGTGVSDALLEEAMNLIEGIKHEGGHRR